jgi:protein-S-isoprenylcysteine O-methyltransferase Ste14
MDIKIALFVLTVLFEFLLGGSFILSLLYPKHRIWPPPKKSSIQYWYIHTLTETSILSFLILGVLDYDTFILKHNSRFVIASLLIVAGGTIFLWAFKILSVNTSLGAKRKLITCGPYKYSRNPQYLGVILFFLGFMTAFNSVYTYVTGINGIILFILALFSEEPWLKDQYKKEYDKYCKKVPRIIKI